MSRKGCSPDNAACEGFFGRLKTELFYPRQWQATTLEQFMQVLDSYIRWYNETRIKLSLGSLSPIEFRESLEIAAYLSPSFCPHHQWSKFGRRGQFETELALWNSDETTHLVAIATFGFDNAGVAAVEEMALVLTTENWITVEQFHDMQLLAALIDSGRRFSKGLRYNLASSRPLASVGLDNGRGVDALASCSCGTLPFAIEVVRRVTQT